MSEHGPAPAGLDPDATTTTDLDAERHHLARAWDVLRTMRERTTAQGDVAADQLTSWSLGKLRAERLVALADDPAVASGRRLPSPAAPPPLFFGRLDWDPLTGERTSHIGRRHVREEAGGEPLVIDWRAPVARAFYRATPADPQGVRRRRRFGFSDGRLTSYEDEPLDRAGTDGDGAADGGSGGSGGTGGTGEGAGGASRILREEIERPRVGPMRDIVATIQPEQDDLVRADLDTSICVQGAPGTGKTAVGLHRAAYLLYTYPERLRRAGVLVVGPNRAFLRYIAAVLPALGEFDVEQTTVDDLVAGKLRVRGTDAPEVARLKGDARLAEVLRRAVYRGVARAGEPAVVLVGTHRYRVAPESLRRWVDDLRRGGLPYAAARDRLGALLAQDVRRQWEGRGGAPSDAETRRIARSAPVRETVEALWPAVDARGLLARLLSDRDLLASCADGLLDAAEVDALVWDAPPSGPRAARWSPADAVLVDEISCLLARVSGYGHVVVDEAQDLSAMQCRALARRCATGSFTLLGDLAQATTPWAPRDWAATLAHLGRPEAPVEALTRGYRVPGEVLELANRLLPSIAPGVPAATSVRGDAGALRLCPSGPDLAAAVVGAARDALGRDGSVGVVAADEAVPAIARALAAAGLGPGLLADPGGDGEPRLTVAPASMVKGLEFDEVVLVEPAAIAGTAGMPGTAGTAGLARLYVALTRAVSRLAVVHRLPLPGPLAP